MVQLIEEGQLGEARAHLVTLTAPEVAVVLEDLSAPRQALLYRLLPPTLAADVFAYLDAEQQRALLGALTESETRALLAELDPDDRTQLFEELPARVVRELMELLSPVDLVQARELLGYPPQSVGRVMTPHFVAVRPEWTVEEALAFVRLRDVPGEAVNVIYVENEHGVLLDALALRVFVLAQPQARVESIMDRRFVSLSAHADREEAVNLMADYDLEALPVVDDAGALLGVVTFDDVIDIAELEATEDFQRYGAVEPLQGGAGRVGGRELYRKRVGWLVVLVFVNLLSGAIISQYEDVITQVVSLVVFLPLLIGSSGNAGAQASTLMVRAMATGDVRPGDWGRLLGRELLVSGAIGLTMGLAVSLLGLYRGGPMVALVVASTMLLVVVVGSLIGVSLPFVLQRLKLDPATASAPLVTSLADISGVAIYFLIANWLLMR